MPDPAGTDLSLATTAELVEELGRRTEGMVMAYQTPHKTKTEPGSGTITLQMKGCGFTLAIGLATRLRAQLVADAMFDDADEDDADDPDAE